MNNRFLVSVIKLRRRKEKKRQEKKLVELIELSYFIFLALGTLFYFFFHIFQFLTSVDHSVNGNI